MQASGKHEGSSRRQENTRGRHASAKTDFTGLLRAWVGPGLIAHFGGTLAIASGSAPRYAVQRPLDTRAGDGTYTLTRHEDATHNTHKQKVRCGLCTDEKAFSRADALTRHYRVCHPDVDLPSKRRRRRGPVTSCP